MVLDGIKVASCKIEGVPGLSIRGQARVRLLQTAAGEQQGAHRAAAHRREVPGIVETVVLHSSGEVSVNSLHVI